MYNIVSINPKPDVREQMFTLLKAQPVVWGIECTLPDFLPYLAFNLDDQHVPVASGRAAIEMAKSVDLPDADNTTMAVFRPDADALGAIALMNIRRFAQTMSLMELYTRVEFIANNDNFARGPWPGARSYEALTDDQILFKALGVLASNFKMPIERRVQLFEQWLLTGTCEGLDAAKQQVMRTFEACLQDFSVTSIAHGRVAVIQSHHQGAPDLGYCVAPVLIIRNDAFRFNGGEPHVKYTICQWPSAEAPYADLAAVIANLNAIETCKNKWGGQENIIGSPIGESSSLMFAQVIQTVLHHLLPAEDLLELDSASFPGLLEVF